jgi:hypothetical protein
MFDIQITRETYNSILYQLHLVVYLTTLSSSGYIASNDRIFNDLCIEKDMEKSYRVLNEGLVLVFAWRGREKPRKISSRLPVFVPRLKRWTT